MGFARATLKSNHSQETVFLASSLEADVNSKQGFIYPPKTVNPSVENELGLAPGKNVSPPVAAEVLFLFPQQQLPSTRASAQVEAAAAAAAEGSLSSPQHLAAMQIRLKGKKDGKTNKQRKRHFCCYGYRPWWEEPAEGESAVSVKRGMCKSLLPAITLRVGSEFKLSGVIPTPSKSCLVDRCYVPPATKTTSILKQNSRA